VFSSYSGGFWAPKLGFDFRVGTVFKFSIASTKALEPTQSPIKLVADAVSLGVKRQGREADHSPPSSADVKNVGALRRLSIGLHGTVKKRDSFLYVILFLGSNVRLVRRADNLTAIYKPIV
jgi:hypothetical protein